jgi:hypothetical protein
MRSRILILAALLGVAALATTGSILNAQEIGVGSIVRPKGTVPVYRTPPEGAFYKKGEVVDSARTGDRLRVIETKEVATLRTRYLWLKVSPLASNGSEADGDQRVAGWAYAGPVGGASNFEIAEGKPSGSN